MARTIPIYISFCHLTVYPSKSWIAHSQAESQPSATKLPRPDCISGSALYRGPDIQQARICALVFLHKSDSPSYHLRHSHHLQMSRSLFRILAAYQSGQNKLPILRRHLEWLVVMPPVIFPAPTGELSASGIGSLRMKTPPFCSSGLPRPSGLFAARLPGDVFLIWFIKKGERAYRKFGSLRKKCGLCS